MKPLVSGVIGALAALVLAVAWQSRPTADHPDASGGLDTRRLAQTTDPLASPMDAASWTPVNVQCAAGQRALVRQVATPQGPMSNVECVGSAESDLMTWNGFSPAAPQPRIVPAVTTVSAPAQPERVVYREPAPRPASRTWKKSAMVIGGAAGAGAGVGGLAGGKKGALIGAAVGGGAATLYEATKRR